MSIRRAFAFSFVDRYAALLINVGSSMIIARLLSPNEIGVYSVAMVLLAFVASFRDLGAGQYLVQKKDLDENAIRATWGVQLGLGLLFAAVIALSSLPAARFYDEPRMAAIMLVLSLNFALTPFQALPFALLTRDLSFGSLAAIRTTGALTAAACAILLAFHGTGPISLAWANLAATIAGGALALVLIGKRHPWRPRLAGARQVISFGSRMTVVSLLSTLRNSTPELFLGKLQGMTETGLWSRGQGLVSMFERLVMDAVNAVAFPMFAKRIREGDDVAGAFVHLAALTSVLGWSFLACLAILAYPFIRVLYGVQWDAAVDPTRWLAVAMILAVPSYICIAPLVALGAIAALLRVAALATVVSIVGVAVGASVSTLFLSQVMAGTATVASALWLHAAHRHITFEWRDLGLQFAKSLAVAIASTIVPLLVTLTLGWRPTQYVLTLAIAIPGAAAGFVAAAYFVRHPIWEEISRVARLRRRAA